MQHARGGHFARIKSIAVQVAFLGLVAYGLVHIFDNVADNLRRHHILSGFQFLNESAGFAIISTPIAYSESSTYFRAFLVGLCNTFIVSCISLVLCTIVGFLVGIARLSRNWLVATLATTYVEVVRNIPLLLQIFFWYFGVLRNLPPVRQSFAIGDTLFLNNRGLFVPSPLMDAGHWLVVFGGVAILLFLMTARKITATKRMGVGAAVMAFLTVYGIFFVQWERPLLQGFNFQGGIDIIPECVALVVALSLYTASFVAEVVRSGLMSVPQGQREAARALGLSPWQIQRYIVIPQGMKVMVPQLSVQYLNVFKNSSLGTAIAYPDLMNVFAGTVLNQTGQAIEVVAMTIAVYLTISLMISAFMGWYNRRIV